ncbi:MAG: DUF1553 domain-containing protein [Planctomycetales bacterium]
MDDRAGNLGTLCLALVLLGLGMVSRTTEGQNAPAKSGDSDQKFTDDQVQFFEKQVRPILQARCWKCHGGEEKLRGGLRMTSRSALLKGGDQGPAVSIDAPAESLLLQAINYDGLEMPPAGRLPNEEVAILTKWVKDGLAWTPGGEPESDPHDATPTRPSLAEARNYWAYRRLTRPPIPEVKANDGLQNPIDAFIQEKLEQRGLAAAPPADRVALVRRAFYDLTGLPPTPEEVDAFVSDRSKDAYERLIDRLLESPHYGEKWGRHWLDLVRFAETHGYERDSVKPFAWRYRDYVIDAFNEDKPFDRFLLEQIAGDELEEVTPETLTATGYYRLGIWDDEPADRALARYEVLDGVVSTTSQVVLGMTVGCARCHDHKKDPISQRDYYRLLSVFRNVTDMNVGNLRRIATDADREAHARQVRDKQIREEQIAARLYQFEQRFAEALSRKKGIHIGRRPRSDLSELEYRFYRDTWDRLPNFDGFKPETSGRISHNFITLAPASRSQAIGLVYEARLLVPTAGEYAFDFDVTAGMRLTIGGQVVIDLPRAGDHRGTASARLAAGPAALRLEYFNANEVPRLNLGWSGPDVERRSLTEAPAAAKERELLADSRQQGQEWAYTLTAPSERWMQPRFDDAAWKRGPGGFGVHGTPGAVVRTEWKTDDIWLRKRFDLESVPEGVALTLHHDDKAEIYLNGQLVHRVQGYTVEYRTAVIAIDQSVLKVGENVIAVHCHQMAGGQYIDVGLAEAPEHAVIADHIRRQGADVLGAAPAEEYARLAEELAASRKMVLPEPGIEVMAVEERGGEPTHILIRGNPGAPGEEVQPGIPTVLEELAPAELSRRDNSPTTHLRRQLADWLTSRTNPLTPRVLANRLWQYHFGRGIVPTPNDFGKLGEPPTHPELLDWLAAELVDGQWKLKRMHRLIMLSRTYQMSSRPEDAGLAADPANSLLWRFPMRRLTAEEVRDSVLSVSGRLNLQAGGTGVYPPIPKEVLAGQSVPGSGWGSSPPDQASRRSIYVHVKRSLLVPILSHHDQADTDSSCPVRYTTTVPTQALSMLNGEFSQEQAALLAERLQREHPGDLGAQIARAIRLTTARSPSPKEIDQDARFVRKMQSQQRLSPAVALQHYCLLVLNANEFIYLD